MSHTLFLVISLLPLPKHVVEDQDRSPNYEMVLSALASNHLDANDVFFASWWREDVEDRYYRNIKLYLQDITTQPGKGRLVILGPRTHTIPGVDLKRFLLFDEEGRFLDQLTLDINVKIASIQTEIRGDSVGLSLIDFAAPPEKGFYPMGLVKGDQRITLEVAVDPTSQKGYLEVGILSDKLCVKLQALNPQAESP